jgi:hypothetical protein
MTISIIWDEGVYGGSEGNVPKDEICILLFLGICRSLADITILSSTQGCKTDKLKTRSEV